MNYISKNIKKTIICQYLPNNTTWKARLWCDYWKGTEVSWTKASQVTDSTPVDEDGEQMVYFTFDSNYANSVAVGTRLHLTIWNSDQTQEFVEDRAFKVVDNYVVVPQSAQ